MLNKRVIPFFFLATPVLAQPATPLQQQLDGMVGSATRTLTQLSSQVAIDAQQIEALQRQVQTLTAEKAELEKKLAAKPAEK